MKRREKRSTTRVGDKTTDLMYARVQNTQMTDRVAYRRLAGQEHSIFKPFCTRKMCLASSPCGFSLYCLMRFYRISELDKRLALLSLGWAHGRLGSGQRFLYTRFRYL
jgi:hypothetical protein